MSGICGVFFHEKQVDIGRGDLEPMRRALEGSRAASLGESFLSLGPLGLGVSGFQGHRSGVSEIRFHGRALALAFHGSLHNWSDLLSKEEPDPLKSLLHLYAKEKMAFLYRLRGEFVLALWDGDTETLYLATDRFRVHSLSYYLDPEKIVFASRIPAIRACPFQVRLTLDPASILEAAVSSVIATPRTIFREVKKLPSGSLLAYRKGKVTLESYWELNFLNTSDHPISDLAQETRKLFREAIEIRVRREDGMDRVGTFLSGGVDSSTVAGVLTQVARYPIKTFSIGFGEERFNEINYARIAAKAFGTDHHEYFVLPKDTFDMIPLLIDRFDEPYANASAVPTYLCSKMARDHGVDLLFAGDGGDELFAGNERYATQRLFDYYHQVPMWVRLFLKPMTFTLADYLKLNLFVKGKKYIQRASIPYPERLTSYGLLNVVPMEALFEEDFLKRLGKDNDVNAPVRMNYFKTPAKSELDRQLYIDLKLAVSDNDLFKVTRMTEAAGVTVQFPFLDHRLAEFAATIPAGIKMKGRQLRSFFKNTYSDLLPLEIRTKKKHGFGLPIPIWLRTDKRLNEMMRDLVLGPRSIQRGYFQKKMLEKLIEQHRTDETSFYGTALWNLMMLELWHQRCWD